MLPPSARATFAPFVNGDLAHVRVHADGAAAASAEALGARAYTVGRDIYFGDGQLDLASGPGRRLMAHELVHTAQPPGSPPRIRRDVADTTEGDQASKQDSARFGGDKELEKIAAGSKRLKKGDRGIEVTKLQQALVDMGYSLPGGVDGDFGKSTFDALVKFQHDETIPETGAYDAATLDALNKRYDTRKPYLDNATFDPANPTKGLRGLRSDEKTATTAALVPQRGTGGGASSFQDDVGGDKYGDEMRKQLDAVIKALHKELFEDKKPLRADPAKNFEKWSVLEQTADASRDVTDAVYGSFPKGPKMTAATGNFIDQWEDEVQRNALLSDAAKKDKAVGKVWYLITSNCDDVNNRHAAVPADTQEKGILDPIVASFVDTDAKVQTVLELEIGWEGSQLEGKVFLQRYKQASDTANRTALWNLFQICIHEYIHSLANTKYQDYADSFRRSGDSVRYNTLIEGMCDFFTENVRATVNITDALRKKVEGPYYDGAQPVPSVTPDVYGSRVQAEQAVAIVGIRNAEAAYFKGDVARIGGP